MWTTYSCVGEDLTEAREKKWIFTNGSRKVIVAQTIVMILVHLFQGDLNQLFDTLIGIFITSLLRITKSSFFRLRQTLRTYLQYTTFQQLKNLFTRDVLFTFQRITVESNWNSKGDQNCSAVAWRVCFYRQSFRPMCHGGTCSAPPPIPTCSLARRCHDRRLWRLKNTVIVLETDQQRRRHTSIHEDIIGHVECIVKNITEAISIDFV